MQKGATDTRVRRDSLWHLLSRAETQISIPPTSSLGTLTLQPQSGPCPGPSAHISSPKSRSKLTGYPFFTPFSCYSSLAGHCSPSLLPHTRLNAALTGWATGSRADGRVQRPYTARQGGCSPTSDEEDVSSVRPTSGVESCAAVGQDVCAFAAKS